MPSVVLTQDCMGRRKGDVVEVSDRVAENLIERGKATRGGEEVLLTGHPEIEVSDTSILDKDAF